MSTTYISLLEEARLALQAGEQRLARARKNLSDFLLEHRDRPSSPELAASLEHEKNFLETELDEAERFVKKSQHDLAELRRAACCKLN